MPSTWSSLKVELQGTGDNPGTWGTATNANLGDAVLGEAITGSATVDFASDADVTITLTDFATTQAARNLRLNITESSSGVGSVRNLILGSGCQIEKFYLINNTGTGAKTVKNTSGTGISVPAGKATLVYNNGTNVVDAASYFTSLTLGSALPVSSGGTGLTAGTSGGVLAYTATGTLASSGALAQYGVVYGGGAGAAPAATAVGTATHVLTSNGSGVAPTFQAIPASGVTTFTAGTTGFTPNTATTGAVTLAGTLATANGGTNLGGATPFTSGGVVYASSTSALATGSALVFDGTNLGIGASTPADALNIGAGKKFRATHSASVYQQIFSSASGNFLNAYGDNFAVTADSGAIYLTTVAAQPIVFQTTNTEGMRLTSTGLGIGTTSPAYKLQVKDGAVAVTSADGTVTSTLNYNSIGTVTNTAFTLGTNNTTRFQIGTSGELGIGGATYGSSGQVLTSGGSGAAPTWTSIAGGDATNNIGYLNIPQNSQSAAYTLVLADAGKHIFHPVGDNNARTFTIPANSSVAYPVGTAITFINMAAANVTIAITTDTMYLSSAGTTGSRTLAQYGSATAIKITSTNWLISGSGLT